MDNRFFERPILNFPYEYPQRHWELDAQGQPTQQIIEKRRSAEFITPIPKPNKRKGTAGAQVKYPFLWAGYFTWAQNCITAEVTE